MLSINTSYSFGLDDQEFVLSFETDYPSDFLELVMALRSTEASKYTQLEVPLFTCISSPINELFTAFLKKRKKRLGWLVHIETTY